MNDNVIDNIITNFKKQNTTNAPTNEIYLFDSFIQLIFPIEVDRADIIEKKNTFQFVVERAARKELSEDIFSRCNISIATTLNVIISAQSSGGYNFEYSLTFIAHVFDENGRIVYDTATDDFDPGFSPADISNIKKTIMAYLFQIFFPEENN